MINSLLPPLVLHPLSLYFIQVLIQYNPYHYSLCGSKGILFTKMFILGYGIRG